MTDTNQLPPIPTLQPGDSHSESLIEAAIQGHASTRDAMRWLVRQLVPGPQPAELTDERAAFERWLGITPCGAAHDFGWLAWKARAILAMRHVQSTFCEYCGGNDEEPVDHCMDCTRPVQVPMTYEQIKAEFQRKQDELSEKGASANCPEDLADFTIGVRFAEAHHFGITAQAKKETP